MRLRTATKVLLIAGPACVGLYDLAAFLAAGDQATISRVVLAWSDACAPLAFGLCFAAGVLFGHVFLPQHPDPVVELASPRDARRKGGSS